MLSYYKWLGMGPSKTYSLCVNRQGEWRQVMSEKTTKTKKKRKKDSDFQNKHKQNSVRTDLML